MYKAIYEVTLKLKVRYSKVSGSTLPFVPPTKEDVAFKMRDKAEQAMNYGGNLFWSLENVDVVDYSSRTY